MELHRYYSGRVGVADFAGPADESDERVGRNLTETPSDYVAPSVFFFVRGYSPAEVVSDAHAHC